MDVKYIQFVSNIALQIMFINLFLILIFHLSLSLSRCSILKFCNPPSINPVPSHYAAESSSLGGGRLYERFIVKKYWYWVKRSLILNINRYFYNKNIDASSITIRGNMKK